MSPDDIAPEHDPLAEEMDLITFQEADARLFKELAHTKTLVEHLKVAHPVDDEEIAAQQGRLAALTRVAERLRGQRTQPPLDHPKKLSGRSTNSNTTPSGERRNAI